MSYLLIFRKILIRYFFHTSVFLQLCRLPRKDTPKDFENLNDTPDEWKTDEQ